MFRRFATATIIGAEYGTARGFAKGAHRAVFNYQPKPGFLYVRSRAISSRCNDNFDMFPAEEIEKAYLTFIGKPVFVNHHNEDHRRARGVIIDAALHKDRNPDGTPDTWVEVLHEVDALTYPKLAKAIVAGEVNRTSMGCDVQFSKCSACGNVATSPLEYCAHIPGKKGKRLATGRVAANGKRETQLIFEICSGLSFFENSLLVEPPADPTAYFLGDVEYGSGLEHLGKTATKSTSKRTILDYLYNTGVQHAWQGREPDTDDETYLLGHQHGSEARDKFLAGRQPKESSWTKTASRTTSNSNSLVWNLIKQAEAENSMTNPTSVWDLIRLADRVGDDLDNDLTFEAAKNHPEAHMAGEQHWPAMKPIVGSRPGMKDADVGWFGKHPASIHHIVEHYSAASDEERDQGKRWYPEIGHGAAVMAQAGDPSLSYKEARHKGSGIVSAYSPQAEFHSNMLNAHTALHHGSAPASARKRSPAGPADHESVMGMEMHAIPAQRMLDGEHPNHVLGGPKTHAFYHNLAHGGQESDEATCSCPKTHVTVDAHALSVACGKRIRVSEHGMPDMSDHHTYNHVADMYRDAAHVIGQKEGRQVHPSEVQAVSWLVRQRRNNDKAQTTKSTNTKQKLHDTLRSRGFDPEDIMGASKSNHQHEVPAPAKTAMLRYTAEFKSLAYGETKAPQDVDTLRAENCTVCGNSTAFDGVQCQICGYVAPPRPFGDPDTETAANTDLRKQVLDSADGTADPNDPEQQLGNQTGDPDILDEQAEDAQAEGTIPALTCTNCATGIQPAPAATSNGEPPYPAEGDVCPVCKKGELAADSNGEAGEEGEDADGDGIPDEEEGEAPDSEEEPDEDDEQEDPEEDPDEVPKKKKGDLK